ncbi:50S ribosome-binding GTPase [Candidatus Woesearchaeota archaeon]|nr:50S ribosome-binding GTPase [Candidatus Woesearchaeota archaeon]
MPSFWVHVNQVLKEAQVVIEVLDARTIEETRNIEIEGKIRRLNKKIIYAITKCDLVKIDELKIKIKNLQPSVFISSRDHLGTTILKKKILELSRGEPVIVGVVGYPNVGKSSLINALAGRAATRTSAESGFTKGMQKVKVGPKITLLDTPGVFPRMEKDTAKHGKTGAVDFAKIKDPEIAALHLIEDEKEKIKDHYKIVEDDPEEILSVLSRKWKRLQKGGGPDLEATARQLLKDWQTGKIQR